MAKVNTRRSATIDQWRLNTNEIGAGLGDAGTLDNTSVAVYPGVAPYINQVNTLSSIYTITKNGSSYEIAIDNGGLGYVAATPFDLVISGADLGGVEGINDATVTVTAVGSGVITAVTVSGTPAADVISEFNIVRADKEALETYTGVGTVLTTDATNLADAVNELDSNTDTNATNIGTIGDLTTTATDLVGAVNELDARQGNATLTTSASNLSAAVNELDALQGNTALPTTATTITGAIAEHETDIGQVSSLNTTSKEVVGAINEVRTKVGAAALTTSATSLSGAINEHETQINTNTSDISNLTSYTGYNTTIQGGYSTLVAGVNGLNTRTGTMEGWFGPKDGTATVEDLWYELFGTRSGTTGSDAHNLTAILSAEGVSQTNVASALIELYQSVGATVTDLGNNYLKLDGTNAMTGLMVIDNQGVTSADGEALVLKTYNSGGTATPRITVADSTGAITIAGDVTMSSNTLNAATLQEAGTSLSSKYVTIGTANTITGDKTYTGSVTLNPGVGEALTVDSYVVSNDTYDFKEWIQDTVGAMVSSNTEAGITVTYQDTDGTLDFNVNDPTITLTGDVVGSAVMSNLGNVTITTTFTGENIQDTIAPLITSGAHTGISTTYDDANNRINFALTADPVITLAGDATGSVTLTNLTSGTLTVAVVNDSHTHSSSTISNWTEAVQDTVGGMVTGNTESGIAVTYDDTLGKLNFNVADPTITLTGAVTGSATMTNLGNVSIATSLDTETAQDAVATLLSSGSHTGLSATYDDANNRVNLALTADPTITLAGDVTGSVTLTNLATNTFTLTATVADDSHNHVIGNIDNFTESVQDIVGEMVNPTNTEAGITVTYDDTAGKLNFNVNDPTITLSGDVTGSATMTNLGSINIDCTVQGGGVAVYNLAGTQLN